MASRHAIAALLLRENCSLWSSSRLSPSLSGPVRSQLTLSRRVLHTPPSQLCPFASSLETRRAAVGRCWSIRGLRHKSGKPTPSFKQLQFEDINNAISSSSPSFSPTILIDVREPSELLSTGIIPTALSMPLNSQPDALFLSPDEFLTRFGYAKPGIRNDASPESKSPDSDIVFYCKVGVRARAAAELAVQAGYDPEMVAVYAGSWLDWAERGGKVERWRGPAE